jgi:hypothetical protein
VAQRDKKAQTHKHIAIYQRGMSRKITDLPDGKQWRNVVTLRMDDTRHWRACVGTAWLFVGCRHLAVSARCRLDCRHTYIRYRMEAQSSEPCNRDSHEEPGPYLLSQAPTSWASSYLARTCRRVRRRSAPRIDSATWLSLWRRRMHRGERQTNHTINTFMPDWGHACVRVML